MPCSFSRYLVASGEGLDFGHGGGAVTGLVVACSVRGAVAGASCCQASSAAMPTRAPARTADAIFSSMVASVTNYLTRARGRTR
jgi:hypothetical protein